MAKKDEDLQKAAHYRSFYETARMMKDPMTRLAFYDAVDAYRFDGIEPEGLPFEAALAFTAIRSFIDADCGRKTGGAPEHNQNARKNKTTLNQPQNNYEINLENNYQNNYKTNKDKDKENVNEKENGEGEEKEKEQEKQNSSLSDVDSFSNINIPKDYAKQVFDILEKNDLPCCLKNFLSFLQSDFKYALETLHTKPDLRGLHSDMVLGAVENYALVINNPNTWQGWKNKKSFDRFVSWERFKDFLPDRFCLDNFLDRSTPPPKQAQNQTVGVNRALEILEEVQNEQKRLHG